MRWINEKEFDGSIASNWLLHGNVNYLASNYTMEMFVIREKGILDNYYFKIFNGKEYWNEKECTGNFAHRN